MIEKNGKILKLIGLLMSGAVMIATVVWQAGMLLAESKEYTNEKVQVLQEKIEDKMETIKVEQADMKTDVEVIRVILEERYGKH